MAPGCFFLAALMVALAMTAVAHAAGERAVAPVPAAAATAHPRETEQRMRQDMQSMLSHLAESGALGQHPEQLSLQVDEPARRVSNLGALVDSTSARNAHDGLHVLGATPGSTADRLGLHPGDVIVAVNGTSLRDLGADEHGRALAAATMRAVVEGVPDAAPINVDVIRGGSALALTAPMQAVYLPAVRMELGSGAATALAAGDSRDATAAADTGGCGRISEFDVAPRGERLYAARILLIERPGPWGRASLPQSRVDPELVRDLEARANRVGAKTTVTSRPGEGTRVVVTLPLLQSSPL